MPCTVETHQADRSGRVTSMNLLSMGPHLPPTAHTGLIGLEIKKHDADYEPAKRSTKWPIIECSTIATATDDCQSASLTHENASTSGAQALFFVTYSALHFLALTSMQSLILMPPFDDQLVEKDQVQILLWSQTGSAWP